MNMHVEGQQKLGPEPEDHQMKGVESAMYLGNRLNKKANIREEITFQMQQVMVTWKRLQTYWKATDASKKVATTRIRRHYKKQTLVWARNGTTQQSRSKAN